MRYLILGAGAAGVSAAEEIRIYDPRGEIIILTEDPHGYYSRPGLAYFLSGEIPEKQVFPAAGIQLKQIGVKLLLAQVAHIDFDWKKVFLASNSEITFDRVLIATGSKAIKPALPGIHLNGVVQLDSLEDTRKIVEKAKKARRAVVVGGGITALELVEGLRARKLQVHYFLRKDHFWGNVLDKQESDLVLHRLHHEGIKIHPFTEPEEIIGKNGMVSAIKTKSGELIPCDMVAVAIGVQPSLNFLDNTRISRQRGVLVDSYLRTNMPDTYAAGDVAQVVWPGEGPAPMDVLWPIARTQGKVAGANMAGQNISLKRMTPINVTRLAGITTTIIGAVGRGQDSDLVDTTRGESTLWRSAPEHIITYRRHAANSIRLSITAENIVGAIIMGDQSLSHKLYDLISNKIPITSYRSELLDAKESMDKLLLKIWSAWNQSYA